MDNIINITEDLEERDLVRKFTRLAGIAAEAEDDILKNPLKHLSDASDRMCEMDDIIRRATEALHGSPVSCNYIDRPEYVSISAEVIKRNRLALDILKELH